MLTFDVSKRVIATAVTYVLSPLQLLRDTLKADEDEDEVDKDWDLEIKKQYLADLAVDDWINAIPSPSGRAAAYRTKSSRMDASLRVLEATLHSHAMCTLGITADAAASWLPRKERDSTCTRIR